MSMKLYLEKCIAGVHLHEGEAAHALELIMTGEATEAQIGGLLVALRAKGETVEEIVGFARTMRRHAIRVLVDDPDAIDLCGTGGDGMGTFNISTAAAFVASGAGVTVAKHGNRSVSSLSGSADVLRALGVNIQILPERVASCINSVGIGFLFAPVFHPAMKSAAKTRTDLGVRTIFNILGPLTNPAGVRRQLIGTYRSSVASSLAHALAHLHTTWSCVVCGDGGMDEVSLSGSTTVFDVRDIESMRTYTVAAGTFGLPERRNEAMAGGDCNANAEITLAILRGERSPARDVVVANAGFGIYIAGKAGSLPEAVQRAEESIDSGRALAQLRRLIDYTNMP